MLKLKDVDLAVVGLGYVGLPLAVEFGKKMRVVGFDINKARVGALSSGHDATREVSDGELKSASGLSFCLEPRELAGCNVFIVTVPIPIDEHNRPDLTPLIKASESIDSVLKGAQASGRPMIYSDVMPMPEFGEDAALYFSPFDSMNMGDVLVEALSTPELLSKLSSATVLQSDKFDWESTSNKTWSELPVLAKRSKEGAC